MDKPASGNSTKSMNACEASQLLQKQRHNQRLFNFLLLLVQFNCVAGNEIRLQYLTRVFASVCQ